jgi:hypothetical protein
MTTLPNDEIVCRIFLGFLAGFLCCDLLNCLVRRLGRRK